MSDDRKNDVSGSQNVPVPSQSDLSARAGMMVHAQRAIAAESVLAGVEMIERFRTEVYLWNEFTSKLAVAHSVRDIATMWEECGRHQIAFARRQADLLFDHGKRVLDVTAGLLNSSKIHERDATH